MMQYFHVSLSCRMTQILKEYTISSPTGKKKLAFSSPLCNSPLLEEPINISDDSREETAISVDVNNNDTGDDKQQDQSEKTNSKKCFKHRRFEPRLTSIKEEISAICAMQRARSDTLYGDHVNGETLIIRQTIENITRYRCLSQIHKVPSHKLFSRYYSARPHLLAYTKWLAASRRSSPTATHKRRGSLLPDSGSRRGSLLPDSGSRRGSLLPDSGSRRGSLLPDLGSRRGSNFRADLRKRSLIPSQSALLRSDSQVDVKSKLNARKRGILVTLFSCMSRPRPGIIMDPNTT